MSAPRRRGPRPASERLRRILVMLPWIMERGEVSLAEVAERFELPEAEVLADLERVSMCGLPPYEPGDLVDLFVDEGVVFAGVPRIFTRPLRLTAPEGFALLAAGRAALLLPGADPGGPLARALTKLEAALGAVGLEIELTRPPHTDDVAAAVDDRAQLRIDYWSANRDEISERVVDPLAVFTDRGYWYVVADDRRSAAERTFRIDRIVSLTRTGESFTSRPVVTQTTTGWFTGAELPRARIVVEPSGSWIAERYPTSGVSPRADGRLELVLDVTSEQWLARLLLRAGTSIVSVEPDEWRDLAARTAQRILQRYRPVN